MRKEWLLSSISGCICSFLLIAENNLPHPELSSTKLEEDLVGMGGTFKLVEMDT